jgi:hypothetical protein
MDKGLFATSNSRESAFVHAFVREAVAFQNTLPAQRKTDVRDVAARLR